MIIRDRKHQTEALAASAGREFFAYWMYPGTGKTRVTLKDAMRAYEAGLIDAVLVMSPNNVKDGWVKWDHNKDDPSDDDEVTKHLRDALPRIIKGVWMGSSATKLDKRAWADFEERMANRQSKLVFLSINYEALLGSQFFDFLTAFCNEFRVMIVADESTRIGKPGSRRTKRAIKLADLCPMRRALSGTPVKKSPMKAYSQARFLSKTAMPFKSFFAFRNTFCVMGGFQGRQILSYKNLDYLSDLMAKWSYSCTKDVLDLPPQIWRKRRVYMEPEQIAAYKTMREEAYAEVAGGEVTAPIVLAQITRLQQIAGGYLTDSEGNVHELIPPDRNPKLKEALQLIKDAPGQVVVWFRFVPELLGMAQLLDATKDEDTRQPISYYKFYGDVPHKDRGAIKAGFLRGDRTVLLGTESTGGIGINQFVGADTVIHVSSDFDTEKRVQADDRNHRIGSEVHVKGINYWDILVPNTVDVKIHRVLRTDSQISAKIMRETWKEWI